MSMRRNMTTEASGHAPARAEREKREYDEGTVHAESDRLHRRFAHVFSCPNTLRGERFFAQVISERVPGARVLDYGCYDGWLYPTLAAHGPGEVVGIDISEKGIAAARAAYGHAAQYLVMDAHRLEFPDGAFDFVVGRAILHHLEFERAVREVYRVLRPGGCALFYEPIRGNPAGALLRALTPRARTADELPLSRRQLEWAAGLFGPASRSHFLNLVSVPVGMFTSVMASSPDNVLLRLADRVDQLVSHTPLRYWMRQAVVCWERAA